SAQGFECAGVANIEWEANLTLLCGSNGIAYKNGCYFNVVNCDNKGWTILLEGTCNR
ncbi:hypothetical protein PHYSODRAFT_420928, partial [Phytophthora sojae]